MLVRHRFYIVTTLGLLLTAGIAMVWRPILWALIPEGLLILLGIYDILQPHRNILRNYPIWGHFRYLSLKIRPMIQQYFIADDLSEKPFSREQRQLVYERATRTLDTLPFGTRRDVSAVGYEWMVHSLAPQQPSEEGSRIVVGGPLCLQAYSASRLNISALSFGAISKNAILALNRGAKMGGFYHNTGEGGLSQYHLREGGDVVWQIGTAYFGCRDAAGKFDPAEFQKKAAYPQVKMIELKLSQGAKPAHGGILPGVKITPEIAEIRNIPMGQDCISPPAHSTFSTPEGLCHFIAELRQLAAGKPIGFKLCLGNPWEFMGICKAFVKTGIYPDFITVDGAEGGTGAAPLEFANRIGVPLEEGLIFIHNCLVGVDLRQHIRLICSGKIITGFDMASKIALGADICNSARGMMFALGCVQSLRCNTNECPTGVATQDPGRTYALKVSEKAPRVHAFHEATVKSFLEVIGACGIFSPSQLTPQHVCRRLAEANIKPYSAIYHYLEPGQLLRDEALPGPYQPWWQRASAERF